MDALSEEQRRDLDLWLMLRQLEQGTRPSLESELSRSLLSELVSKGHVVRVTRRRFWLWTSSVYAVTPTGSAALAEKRAQIEELHSVSGYAIAAAQEELRQRGIAPASLLLELMILNHGRFDEEQSGFFTKTARLSRHAMEFGKHAVEDGNDLLETVLFGLLITTTL